MSELLRDGAADARLVHAQEEAGSTPAPATSSVTHAAGRGDLNDRNTVNSETAAAYWQKPSAERRARPARTERHPRADRVTEQDDCDCPNADQGEHYNECSRGRPWRRLSNRQAFGAVAGIVKTPGIDDALDAIESEADVVKENVNLLEGAAQSRAELERWNVLYRETLTQCNKRLIPHGVVLGGVAPNPSGLGAVFAGIDHDKRDYLVTLSLPAKERNDFANASKEDFVRWAIDTICGAVLEQREIYLRRAGLGSKGSN